MDFLIENKWKNFFDDEMSKPYFVDLKNFILNEYQTNIIYPKFKLIFNAFNLCDINNLKVVIIGQDPYHGPNQANGLCFSVNEDVKIPPSLKNILKEIKNDTGNEPIANKNLSHWAKQGVLLLNATLTVRHSNAGSHQQKGWETFTDFVIKKISQSQNKIVFILWGAYAQNKINIIDSDKHLVLKSVHPSPLSAHKGFFGNNHFSKTNKYLTNNDKAPIIW